MTIIMYICLGMMGAENDKFTKYLVNECNTVMTKCMDGYSNASSPIEELYKLCILDHKDDLMMLAIQNP